MKQLFIYLTVCVNAAVGTGFGYNSFFRSDVRKEIILCMPRAGKLAPKTDERGRMMK